MWGWSGWALLLVGGSAFALRARAQPSYLCQCDALLWAPVQQTDPNMTEWHNTLAVEVAQNDLVDASQARPGGTWRQAQGLSCLHLHTCVASQQNVQRSAAPEAYNHSVRGQCP